MHTPPFRRRRVVVLGGGIVGQLAGILLARDGHRVTLLERDAEPPPPDSERCWTDWQRRGVPQFRLAHAFQPRIRQTIEAELPGLAEALEHAGCLRFNPFRALPHALTGGFAPSDERFDMLTGRRPVVEGILAGVAARTPGLVVRRGVAATGLLVDPYRTSSVHVGGVATSTGETLPADLVVDAAGRRSPLGDLLQAAGARRPQEETVHDAGYVYYARDFRSADGELPPLLGPAHQVYDSVSILTIPADRGCWSVVLLTSGSDRALRAARRADVWERVIERFPLARHWMHADWAGDVAVVPGGRNRRRELVVGGRPVATGVVSIGDAWAHTSPSLGRGMAIGTIHAVALRDHLREAGIDRVENALASAARTDESVGPWWNDTHTAELHRLRQIEAQIAGREYAPADRGWRLAQALAGAAGQDPAMLRHLSEVGSVLTRGVDVLARPGVAARALELAATATALPGPSRAELLELLLPIAA